MCQVSIEFAKFGRNHDECLLFSIPQFNDLNNRVLAIESFLNRLEQKVTSTYEQEELVSPKLQDVPFPNPVSANAQVKRRDHTGVALMSVCRR